MKHFTKRLAIAATVAVAALGTPALAGGSSSKNVLGVGAVLSTGKGGLIGSLLGTNNGRGKATGIAAAVSVSTGKGGVLGLLTGSSSRGHGHGGYGHGGW